MQKTRMGYPKRCYDKHISGLGMWSLPTPEVHSSNLDIGKIHKNMYLLVEMIITDPEQGPF